MANAADKKRNISVALESSSVTAKMRSKRLCGRLLSRV